MVVPSTSDAIDRTLRAIRDRRPLVQCIGNAVVLNPVANALLALGASPAMVDAPEESGVLAAAADAVAINLGTVSAEQFRGARIAVAAADRAGIPWVLDPVAVGLLPFRTACAVSLLEQRPRAIRANASEILALRAAASGHPAPSGHGVDTAHDAEAALPAARVLAVRPVSAGSAVAARSGTVVSVSGATDLVTDGTRLARIRNGHPLMTRVTGLGCTATAVLAACLAVEPDPFEAAVHAAVLMGLAGEHAVVRARGPGSLQLELLDALFALDGSALAAGARVELHPGGV